MNFQQSTKVVIRLSSQDAVEKDATWSVKFRVHKFVTGNGP